APEPGPDRHAAFHHVLDDRQVAAPCIGVIAIDVAAEHEPTLVGLADVEMPGAERDYAIDCRLDAFRHEGLQHMAFDRQPKARERRNARGIARDREADLLDLDAPARGVEAGRAP